MRRLLIKRRARARKKVRNPIIIRKETRRDQSNSPKANPRTRWAAGVRGDNQARVDTTEGSWCRGKKTPLKNHMGVTKRVKKLLRLFRYGTRAVTVMAMEANINPTTKEVGIISIAQGEDTVPRTYVKASIEVAVSVERVAPQATSPITRSSTLTGVTMMPSKIMWVSIRR